MKTEDQKRKAALDRLEIKRLAKVARLINAKNPTAPSSKQAPHSQLPNTATPETLADQPEQT